jgi:fructuronate reductase
MDKGQRLTRTALTASGELAPAAPIRIVHLGLGAFHRAHQAWYTAQASDSQNWGIAAFTGRSPTMAERLAPQGGAYTLVERAAEGDSFTHIGSIVAVHGGDEVARLVQLVSAPETALITLTITEAGYQLDLDDPAIAAELERLRLAVRGDTGDAPQTALGRLLIALEARSRRALGPIAIVPCDNLPANGERLGAAISELAEAVDPTLVRRLADAACYVSTSVDRITPRVGPTVEHDVRVATGWTDAAPVVTEPFSDWVLEGEFPAGRPNWETAGARFVSDIEPYESRKLWLLNGAHIVLAFAGTIRGLTTIAEAVNDPDALAAVEELWRDACRLLPEHLDLAGYCTSLLSRFRNPRIEHLLGQIAEDGLTKLRLRIVPVAHGELDAGRAAEGAASAIAIWITAMLRGGSLADLQRMEVQRALRSPDPRRELLALASPRLAAERVFADRVLSAVDRWTAH